MTTDMFRSTVSRRWPSSCTISAVCLPWNAATDSNSSLEQQGIIWKGWQNQHTVCRLSPCYSGSFGSAVCSEHQRPVRDVGLKGGDAQFNQTFGCLCVQGHEPPSQRIRTFGGGAKKPKKQCGGIATFGARRPSPFLFLKTRDLHPIGLRRKKKEEKDDVVGRS